MYIINDTSMNWIEKVDFTIVNKQLKNFKNIVLQYLGHDKYFCIHVYLDTDAINWNERPKGTISSTGGLKASSNTCKLHGKRC